MEEYFKMRLQTQDLPRGSFVLEHDGLLVNSLRKYIRRAIRLEDWETLEHLKKQLLKSKL